MLQAPCLYGFDAISECEKSSRRIFSLSSASGEFGDRIWGQVSSMTDCPQMSLSDSKIRNLKPSAKPFKASDSHGLYLLINPGGSRLWYLKYRFNQKESRIALGTYPQASLSDAYQQRDSIRKLLAQNINPAQQRVTEKSVTSPENTLRPLQ